MNRKSSESHQVHLNGRVVFEVDEVTKISPFHHIINLHFATRFEYVLRVCRRLMRESQGSEKK